MRFDDSKESILVSNNYNLNSRWSVVNSQIIEDKTGISRTWFKDIKYDEQNRTSLHLGYDNKLKRIVTIKTINYLYGDSNDIDAINKRRGLLKSQLNILNEISSPLLPEPLDWFEVNNNVDIFPKKELHENEPVLVLEYQPGTTLRKRLLKREQEKKELEKVRLDAVNRIAKNILYFMMALEEKDYIHLGLSPEHIVMLKDENIRILGLSKIFKTNNSKIRAKDIQEYKTYGYSAPELYTNEDIELDSKAILAFSLGVIIHQLVCEKSTIHDYMVKSYNDEALVFNYPNDIFEKYIKSQVKGQMIHRLICDLCNPDPKKRLTDFDKIEDTLSMIGGESINTPERTWRKINRNRIGEIVDIAKSNKEIIVRDKQDFQQYTIYVRELRPDIRVEQLQEGCNIEFDISQNQKGRKKAVNVRIIENKCSEMNFELDNVIENYPFEEEVIINSPDTKDIKGYVDENDNPGVASLLRRIFGLNK